MIVEDQDTMQLYGHASDLAKHLSIPNAHDRVRDWIRAGKVEPLRDSDGETLMARGHPVYAMADLYAAELATRQSGNTRRHLTKWVSIAQHVP